MEHTKGPWIAATDAEGYVYDDNEILVAAAHCQKTHYNAAGVSAEQMMANARLIAASPTMIEELKKIVAVIKEYDSPWWMDDPNRGGFDLETIEAAIAKATE